MHREQRSKLTVDQVFTDESKTIQTLMEEMRKLHYAPEQLTCNCVWPSCVKAKKCRDRI